jgi:hypothetical protein
MVKASKTLWYISNKIIYIRKRELQRRLNQQQNAQEKRKKGEAAGGILDQ